MIWRLYLVEKSAGDDASLIANTGAIAGSVQEITKKEGAVECIVYTST
jgi:hypothetical protein